MGLLNIKKELNRRYVFLIYSEYYFCLIDDLVKFYTSKGIDRDFLLAKVDTFVSKYPYDYDKSSIKTYLINLCNYAIKSYDYTCHCYNDSLLYDESLKDSKDSVELMKLQDFSVEELEDFIRAYKEGRVVKNDALKEVCVSLLPLYSIDEIVTLCERIISSHKKYSTLKENVACE